MQRQKVRRHRRGDDDQSKKSNRDMRRALRKELWYDLYEERTTGEREREREGEDREDREERREKREEEKEEENNSASISLPTHRLGGKRKWSGKTPARDPPHHHL